MRVPVFIAVPGGLYLSLVLLLGLHPDAAGWAGQTVFLALPYALLIVAFVLGLFFAQTRVSFVSLAAGVAVYTVHSAFFVDRDPAAGEAVILLSCLLLPLTVALFYWLSERGLFTSYGLVRGLALLSVLLFLCLLPLSPGFRLAVGSAASPAFRSSSGWIRIPGLGILAFIAAAAALMVRKKGESPFLGPLLAISLFMLFTGLNFRSASWRPPQAESAFVLFMSAGAFTLAWAVLESAWRHSTLDELTELPNRRALRHHFRCVGKDYCIAIVDVDHFKAVNDTHGHAVGDQVLRFVGLHLAKQAGGRSYRYGGEEFVIVYETGALEEVMKDLEALRRGIGEHEFAIRSELRPARKPKNPRAAVPGAARKPARTIRLTVSIGVARSGSKYALAQEALEAADAALYRAKEAGRNRVCRAR